MIVYIQQIRVAGWIRVVLSWLLLYMGLHLVIDNRIQFLLPIKQQFVYWYFNCSTCELLALSDFEAQVTRRPIRKVLVEEVFELHCANYL